MTNPYYTHTTFPAPNAPGSSAALRAELDAVSAGFDKLPELTGNADKLVVVNSTGTALTATPASFAPLASPAFTGTPTAPTAAAGTNTTQLATTAFVSATAFSAALPAQSGNAGKFVTTDGTNASWGDPWTGAEFIANGSISLGAAVAVRTDGQVEAVAESAGTYNTSGVLFDTNAAYLASAYHVALDKYVFVYADADNSNYGTAVVATLVGQVLTFGTPVVFRSATVAWTSVAYDSVNQKMVIAYQDGGNSSYGTAIVGTVSGTTISFGMTQVFNSAGTAYCGVAFDASAGQPVIVYQNTPNQYGYAIVGTVSGTAISFGGSAVNLPASATTSSFMVAAYDSTNSKTVIFFRDIGGSAVRGVVGTVSGSAITLGSPTQLATNASYLSTAFAGSGKCVVGFQDTSNNGGSVVASVSGTTLTFGSVANFIATTMSAVTPAVVYDSVNDRVVVQYATSSSVQVKVGTVSGTTISYGAATTVDSQSGGVDPYLTGAFNSTQGRVGFAYRPRVPTQSLGYVWSNRVTNANSFIGFAQNAASASGSVRVATANRVDANRTGLVDGTLYYINYNGTLSTANTGYVLAGRAQGATRMLVNGAEKVSIDDYLPAQTGNSSKFLTTNGATASWSFLSPGSSMYLALTAGAL